MGERPRTERSIDHPWHDSCVIWLKCPESSRELGFACAFISDDLASMKASTGSLTGQFEDVLLDWYSRGIVEYHRHSFDRRCLLYVRNIPSSEAQCIF